MSKRNKKKIMRSGSASCPVCNCEPRPLEEHHMRGRKVKKPNDPWNIVYLCSKCHEDVHLNPPQLILECWRNTSDGRQLFFHKRGENSITGEICIPPLIKKKALFSWEK